ncbi:hypothetical protein [Oceanisphaera sp.]|uniref:hypothetical protein n=1 Tax=Oceanisphaera sp. TaxID=1929979 RepID=UPI003A959BB0
MKWTAGLLVLTSTMTFMVQASEKPAIFSNGDIGVLLSDDILGAQRGKFVAQQRSHYFGIEFVTNIAGPNGTMLTSGMQLNVNFNNAGRQPEVGINVYGSGTPATGSTTHSGSLAQNSPNGSGVVQLAQIAGNANTGINDFSFQPGMMPMKDGTALTQSHYQLSLPGGMVRYEFTASGMGMAFASDDGKITAAQMVRSNNGNQGFVQQFSIADNNKLLSNEAKFYMGDKAATYAGLAQTLRQQLPTGIK